MTFIEKIKDIDEYWKALYFSLLLILITGILPSLCFVDWVWFSRSGSLLVAYGIYIVWRDYQGDIDSALATIASAAKDGYGEQISQEFVNTVESIRVSNKKLYQKIEFLILGTGTLIWGYGDLLGKLNS